MQLGTHRIHVEGDIVFTVLIGDFTPQDFQELRSVTESVLKSHNRFFSISDISQLRSISPQARRLAAEWYDQHASAGSALIGASSALRILINLMDHALRLLRRPHAPTVFMKTEQEARDWVEGQRQPPKGPPTV